MRIKGTILILLITKICSGQGQVVGIYNDHFSERIELKADSTFTHYYRFDLASSWTNGKWRIENDTIYLKTELIMDTLQIRNSENQVIRDSLVLSADQIIGRIEYNDLAGMLLSGGGQNRVNPPNKLFFKRKKLFRIRGNGTLDLTRVKAFWTNKKHKTYFRKESR